MPTHAEAMANELAARGVQYVFGLPGGEIVAFIDACRRAGMRFLLTGHEASAAWMAQVVGQITGVPGVCATTLGPGATNLVTAVANAFLDRAPMLAITAQIPASAIDTMTHQRLPLERLFSPITKASFAIEKNAADLIDRAMNLALEPRPGPVHVSLASDLATTEDIIHDRTLAERSKRDDHLRPISKRLGAAKRPLVLIGLGATPSDASAIRALIGQLQAPFLVTPKVKGIVPEDHPLFAGVASGMAIDRDIVETIRAADLILAIGFDPVECDKTWFADVEVVSIDSVSMAEGRYQPLEAIGHIAQLVASLSPDPKPWPSELLEQRRKAIYREPGQGNSPLRLIQELRAIFPRDGIATCDVGSHKLLMGQFWRAYEPGTFFMSNGLSGMGFGVPAAIAAQLVHPKKAVLAVVGDGGMLMMLHDLALIRELALPIIIVVLSDRSLSLIRVSEERRGIKPYGVDFTPPDFAKIAEAFGIPARKAQSIQEARDAVERALTARSALLIDVPIDYREYYDLV
ncbi:MAG TPA: thiamine pyrophosphate-binding protein [Bryobacteraceae bacterium]|nr:thiamine pyrophosphate-binding protein [Bryobacteraceae bacterium]